jgi:flagella basal body P-ring formation protein FlgA
MTTFRHTTALTAAVLGFVAAGGASAAPELRADITVTSGIVTVGDMFADPGEHADKPLFRAPRPGTAGNVELPAIRAAMRAAGLAEFDTGGISSVRVGRAATIVDEPVLTDLLTADLTARGIVHDGVVVRASFDAGELALHAEAVPNPVRLLDLTYASGTGSFTARFSIAGLDRPLDLTGRIDLLVPAPHLAEGKPTGAILGAEDVEMRLVPLKFAGANGIATAEQLIGKQLRHQSRGGLLLRPDDVVEPQTVKRNAMVTVVLRNGPLTLTVKGQALNSAAAGQPVQVLNTVSRRILHGVATANGAVEMSDARDLAGL